MNWTDLICCKYRDEDPLVNCRSVTLQVTKDCNLRCTYCYQTHKSNLMMSQETGIKCIDLLFKMYEEDNLDSVINKHTKGLALEFIGGEPLLNIETVTKCIDYFFYKCKETDHIWWENTRIFIGTNGILYNNEKVQQLIHKYKYSIVFNITLDGPQEVQDLCRKTPTGEGSFKYVIPGWLAYKNFMHGNVGTKITISPQNLPQLSEICHFFIEQGIDEINCNPIYEHDWTIEEAKIYYQELKKIANMLVSTNDRVIFSVFKEHFHKELSSANNKNWCGGTGDMLAFDPEGKAYPCLRYMEDSLGGAQKPIIIGDINALYATEEQKQNKILLDSIDRRTQSSDECWNCKINSGCSWCSAYNYQIYGTPNKRSTNVCWMHKAASLAHVYYTKINHNIPILPIFLNKQDALKIISEDEYNFLLS